MKAPLDEKMLRSGDSFRKVERWEEDYDSYLYSRIRLPFYIRSERKTKEIPPFSHTHFGFELGMVAEGRCEMIFEQSIYPMKAGDFYFVDCMIPHGHSTVDETEIIWAHSKIEPVLNMSPSPGDPRILRPFLALRMGLPPVLSDHSRLAMMLMETLDAYESGGSCSDLVAWNRLSSVFIHLAEEVGGIPLKNSSESALRYWNVIQKAVQYIHVNYARPFSLSSLASECHLSVSRFSELFSQIMRHSPIEYRNLVRIQHAMELILRTDDKLITIAYECGFASLSQFNALFKRINGLTPSAYRRGQT